ncbi:MAG: hypothetical protein ACYCUZ_06010 [Cuniculiplasma sp.]
MIFVYILIVEILMTPIISYSVYYTSRFYAKMGTKEISFLIFFLAMMSGMLNSVTYFIIEPTGFINQVTAINISMFEMSVFLSYLLVSAYNGNLKTMNKGHRKWMAALIGWNEISMAFLLYVIAYGFGNGNTFLELTNLIGYSVTNYLFVIPMVIEMSVLYLAVKHPPLVKRVSISIIMMQLADPAIIGPSWYILPASVVFSAIMILAIYLVFNHVYRNMGNMEENWKRMLSYFILIIALSSAGLIEPVFVNSYFGVEWLLFSISMMTSMIFYFSMSFGVFSSKDSMNAESLQPA